MANRYLHLFLYGFIFSLGIVVIVSNPAFAVNGKKALSFIANKGQVTDQNGNSRTDIDFKLTGGNGLNIFIGKGAIHYQWLKGNSLRPNTGLLIKPDTAEANPVDMYRMDVQLLGANPNAAITTERQASYTERYYTPSAGSNGVIAQAFGKVVYHDVYPNIDWVFYFNSDGNLEHDFIVRPGGRVSDIKLKYGGSTNLKINSDGSLSAITPFGEVLEKAPYAYIQNDNHKLESAFVLHGDLLSFSAAAAIGTVVIDPTLEWGTYFGGNDVDYVTDVVTGKGGYVFITGATNSMSNIATTGAYQFTFGGGSAYSGSDAFISKFDMAGNCLWSTYYGGSDEDASRSISRDTSGNLYIAGYTYSTTGFATTGAHQTMSGGSYDAFIAGFDTSGQRLWGTYFGGPGEDGWNLVALHCDRFNNIYLTGQTNSSSGIASIGANQSNLYAGAGDQDAFLAKFNTSGLFVWATYFGGNFGDAASSITTDTAGNIYITGNTNSTTGIASTGQTINGGGYDAFIAKYDPSGNKTWSTYLGGNNDDYALGIACDDSSNIYIGGQTLSTSGLVTAGAYQGTYGGGYVDGVLAKFNTSGTLLFSTYYGGTSEDAISRVYCAANGNIYVSGLTGSTGMATPDGPQPNLGGYYDAFLSRFSTSGSLLWGSYIGGTDYDEADAVYGDASGNIYTIGYTTSGTGIATAGAWQNSFGGGDYDGFLVRIKDCTAPLAPDTIIGSLSVCAGSNVAFYTPVSIGASSYNWILPSGWLGSSNTDSIGITFGENSGTLKLAVENYCASSDTVSVAISVNALPVAPPITRNGNTLSVSGTFTAYQWLSNGQPVSSATSASYAPPAEGNYSVIVYNVSGCSDTSLVYNYSTPISAFSKSIGIAIYPNPAASYILINSAQKGWIGVYDIQGKLLLKNGMAEGVNHLFLNELSAGVYTIKFIDNYGKDLGSQQLVKSGN